MIEGYINIPDDVSSILFCLYIIKEDFISALFNDIYILD